MAVVRRTNRLTMLFSRVLKYCMERVGMVNSISTVMVVEVTLMERVGTISTYQYHGNAGGHNGDKDNNDGEGEDAGVQLSP